MRLELNGIWHQKFVDYKRTTARVQSHTKVMTVLSALHFPCGSANSVGRFYDSLGI